jgi:hypothetical protein
VVAHGTLRPLRALVELLPLDAPAVPRRVRADEQGRFQFTDLAANRYRVTARCEGFVALEFGQRQPPEPGTPVEVKDGGAMTHADFVLPRMSAVEGVLRDEFGEPAPDVEVQVARVMFAAGAQRLMPVSTPRSTRSTDDRGQFRIHGLPPGDYYLLALSGPFTTASQTAGFAMTFYPGTTSATEARAVHLDPGEDAVGLTFQLVPSRDATLSGIVVDPAGQPTVGSLNLLQLQGGDVRAIIQARVRTEADGAFVFRNVPWGNYVLQGSGGTQGFVSLRINVAQPAMTNIMLRLKSPGSGRGRIEFEGDAPLPPVNRVRVQPRPVNFVDGPVGGGPAPYTVNNDWTFEVTRQLSLARLLVEAPPPWRVKRVLFEGKDVTDTALDFLGRDLDGFVVTMSSRQTSVSGAVADGEKPALDCLVIMFAEDSARWTFPSRFMGAARPNQQGQFVIDGLPPGGYLALALPTAQSVDWQDPEFLEKVRGLGTRVTLAEAEKKTLDLKLVQR